MKSETTAWLLLASAGMMEILWLLMVKYAQGFSRLWPTLGVLVFGGASVYLLSLAVRNLPIGTAYAVWTGIGAVGGAFIGIAFFDEPKSALRLISIALIIMGIIGLKLSTSPP